MSTAVRFVVVVFALLTGVLVGAGPAQAQPDVYVNASNGPGGCSGVTTVSGLDGSSWSCAYPDLQDAINSATGGDEIWVAEGVYKPASSTDSIAFSGAKDGLKIYGGFQSGDTFSQRNPEGNVTILSGDVGGTADDDPDGDNIIEDHVDINGENATHVLYLDGVTNGPITGSTVIDGLTITAGQADATSESGGGLYCDAGTVGTPSECSPTLRNVVFIGHQGGALFAKAEDGISSPTIVGAVFRSNDEGGSGGGVAIETINGGTANPTIINSIFIDNESRGSGGGGGFAINVISSGDIANPSIINSVFVNNDAIRGGAIANRTFSGTVNLTIVNSTITNNSASSFSFEAEGGAIFNEGSVTVQNAILWGNSADNGGGEIHNDDGSATLNHTIVESGAAGSKIENVNGGSVTDNGGNLDQDPLFADPSDPDGLDNTFATVDDGLNVLTASPASDAGDGTLLPSDPADLDGDTDTGEPLPRDLTGNAREKDGSVNMGAYEVSPPSVTEVRPRSGAPGSTLRIYGTRFDTDKTDVVTIGGQTATINNVLNGGAAMDVTVPSGTGGGTVNVSVEFTGGTTSTLANTFDVVTGGSGAFAAIGASLTGVDIGSASWGDYDGDGDLDLVVTGNEGSNETATIYRNDGGGAFTDIGAGLTGVDRSSSSWGDYDGDGDLDLVVTGFDGSNRTATIYENDVANNNGFTPLGAGLTGVMSSSSSWGDYNGDGKLDLVITGSDGSNDTATIYRNDGGGVFTDISAGLTGVEFGSSSWGDVGGDGDLDLVVTGQDGSSNATATIYENDVANNNGFTPLGAGLTGVKSNSSSSWGDYDGDGDLDLVVTGNDDSFNEAATIYFNDVANSNGFTVEAELAGVEDGSSSWGDVDGDGDLDLVVTGQDDSFNETATIYENDVANNNGFTPLGTGLTGVDRSSSSWGDVDGDGDLDLVVTGNDGNSGQTATIYENLPPPSITINQGGTTINDGETFDSGTTPQGTDLTTSFTVSNTGGAPLEIANASVTNGDFFSVSPSTATISAGGSATFDVTLDGTNTGTQNTGVTFESNDPATPSFTFSVTGEVVDTTPPSISNVSLSASGSDNLDLTIETSEPLGSGNAALQVSVDGPSGEDLYVFNRSDFSESGTTYTLTATQPYDDGDGTYSARVDDALDPAGNDGADGTQSDSYTFDGTPPTVTAITRTSATPTNADIVTFAVTFSEPVESLGDSDFALSNDPGGGASIESFGPTTVSSVDVTVTGVSGDGPLGLNVADGDGDVTDAAGNPLDTSEPTPDETYTIDNVAPSISSVLLGTRPSPFVDTVRADTDDAIALRFTSGEPLGLGSGAVQVTVGGPNAGPDWKTFSDPAFAETDNGDGTFTYTLQGGTLLSDGPGEYKAIVDRAKDPAGNDGSGGQSDAVLGVAITVQAGEAPLGESVDLTVTVDDGGTGDFLVDQAALQARKGGADTYRQQETKSGSFTAFTGTVESGLVTTRGIDYYVRLTSRGATSDTTFTVPSGGLSVAENRPAHIPVSFEELSPPENTKEALFQAEIYRMVSVPALPSGGIKEALRSDYGSYDTSVWRLERWKAGRENTSGGYDGFPDLEALQVGEAFWLTTEQGQSFALQQGRTVKADTIQEIPLKAGWNQVGNPFGFPVPWQAVVDSTGFSDTDYDGPVGYRDGDFTPAQDSLDPWKGYFVYNATGGPDTLKVPPVGETSSNASPALTEKRPEAQLAEAGTERGRKAASGRYTLEVRALSKSGTAKATLGLWPKAKAGRGPYDHAQPPSVTGGLRLSALETVNGSAVPHSHSIKPRKGGSEGGSGGGQSWTLRLWAPEGGGTQNAKLRLTGSGTLPGGYSRYVLDLKRERRITPGAQLTVKAGETRRLKVIAGTKSYAKDNSEGISLKSLETTLRANYPNPFDDRTTVEYVVAEKEAGAPVTIQVYNVLGQRVETLVDGPKSRGLHTVTWDGTNRYGNRVGSGVFFLRLRAGDVSETQKAVLVR